ncbi:hypothetical protein C1646_685477 [Rhizophagus diaphanus]|nr:hypothetical protein C1646_685477 [Rhizophagus diaphanus] [Rhizophagus sp. MUCL 43196]
MIMFDKLGLSYLIKNYSNIECYLLMILLRVVDVHSTVKWRCSWHLFVLNKL